MASTIEDGVVENGMAGAVEEASVPEKSRPRKRVAARQADGSEQQTPIARLTTNVGDALRESLPRWKGRVLARFEWGMSDNSRDRRSTEVVLLNVEISEHAKAIPILTMRFSPSGEPPVDIAGLSYQLTASDGGNELGLHFRYRKGVFKQAVLVTATALGTGEVGEAQGSAEASEVRSKPCPVARLPGAKGGLAAPFGAVWCTDDATNALLTEGWGLRRHRRPTQDCALDPWWPTWDDGDKVFTFPVPDCTKDPQTLSDEWCGALLASTLCSLLVGLFTSQPALSELVKRNAPDSLGLPKSELYFVALRAVDLDPSAIANALAEKGIIFPPQVIDAACTALNSGRHVILTGPPGNGKTELALYLARAWAHGREERPEALIATASPAWTTGDLIGRYFPTPQGGSLEFREGFFLRALRERRWLIVDEFNRAPIDACFGELFTVLSGHPAELPYQVQQDGGPPLPVRVLPKDAPTSDEHGFVDYRVFDGFRMIGTMNDADRLDLNRLSFALLRRFDVIRIEAPAAAKVKDIIDDSLAGAIRWARIGELGYQFGQDAKWARTTDATALINECAPVLHALFAPGAEGTSTTEAARRPAKPQVDLLQDRVIGVAIVRDVVRFAVEGMRAGSSTLMPRKCVLRPTDDPRGVLLSTIAMSLVLKLLPQLDATEHKVEAIRLVLGAFGEDAKADFVRIVRREREEQADAGAKKSEWAFEVQIQEPPLGRADLDRNARLSIGEYIVDECRRHFRMAGIDADLAALLPSSPPDERE